MTPRSRTYRWVRWLLRYLRLRDFLEFALAGAMAALAWNTYTANPRLARWLVISYALGLLVLIVATYRQRRARDYIEGQAIRGLLRLLNREVFDHDSEANFTYFSRSRFFDNELIPWYRFKKGTKNAIKAAFRSSVHFQREEGVAGQAWAKPGQIHIGTFGPYASRNQLRADYVDRLKIRAEVVDAMSDRMLKIRTVLAYGLMDSDDRLLGVITIDLLQAVCKDDDGTLRVNDTQVLHTDRIELIFSAVASVLGAFADGERGKKWLFH